MKFVLVFICLIFFLGLLGIFLKRSHLLTLMLCLELLLVSLFVGFCVFKESYKKFSFCRSSLILLTFSACEARVGLSLLITVSRVYSSNKIYSLKLLRV